MTAGYPDFVQNPKLDEILYGDPFKLWTTEEQIDVGLSTPRVFAPGANWDYSHTDYVILGVALEKITGQPLDVALKEQVLDPMGLENTVASLTAEITRAGPPCFHVGTPAGSGHPERHTLHEESTYWNPSWTIAQGAIQTTNIVDMTTTAVAVGEERFSRRSPTRRRSPPISSGSALPWKAARTATRSTRPTTTDSVSCAAATGSCRIRSSRATARDRLSA